MPNLITSRCRPRMGKQGYDNSKQLADAIGYPHSRIRNGVGGSDAVGWVTIYAIARALQAQDETLDQVVQDIVATDGGVPDDPPQQPQGPTGPTRRQDTEDERKKRSGPKRVTRARVA